MMEYLASFFTFPYELLARWFRAWSLSGQSGNIAALILYLLICFIPILYGIWVIWKRGIKPEDILLPILSAVLALGIYRMINPHTLPVPEMQQSMKILYSMAANTVGGGYVIIRLLRYFFHADMQQLQKCFIRLLWVLIAVFSGVIVIRIIIFPALIKALQESNTGAENLLLSYINLGMELGMDLLPYCLDIWVCIAARQLLLVQTRAPYTEQVLQKAKRLALTAARSLLILLCSEIVFHVLQLLWAPALHVLNSTLSLPVFSIGFVLTALLAAKLLQENKALKDSNDLFI